MFKKISSFVLFMICMCLIVALVGCGAEGAPINSFVKGDSAVSKEAAYLAPGEGVDYGASYADEVSGEYAEEGIREGEEVINVDEFDEDPRQTVYRMTAEAWNDNDHYRDWLTLFVKDQEGQIYFDGIKSWGLNSRSRLTVTVKASDQAVSGAAVICKDKLGVKKFSAITDTNGVAYVFPEVDAGTVEVVAGSQTGTADFDLSKSTDIEIKLDSSGQAFAKPTGIRLMFVVDVTGSMGDELSFLKNELLSVLESVEKANANVPIYLSMLFYRDDGDREKFNFTDFALVDLNKQTQNDAFKKLMNEMDKQVADGGGDYPEALDEALQMAVEQGRWGNENETRILFHIYDAPAHEESNHEVVFEKAVRSAAEKGIRICPVLCSGADVLCEYLGRQAAIYTGGTSVFVTDDSGIGGSHLDPNIPERTVEYLDDLIVRLINGYFTGTFEEPVSIYGTENVQQDG